MMEVTLSKLHQHIVAERIIHMDKTDILFNHGLIATQNDQRELIEDYVIPIKDDHIGAMGPYDNVR